MQWHPISERVQCVIPIPVPTLTLPPHRHTNSFLFGDRELGLVDAGQWDAEGVRALTTFISEIRGGRLDRLFLTHWHPDHRMAAEVVRQATGCAVGVHCEEADKVDSLQVDFMFEDGDTFDMDGRILEVIHTPGHSAGHCCFLLRPEGVLFTGDHILGLGTSIVVPPDGDMARYMRSLEKLTDYEIAVICPGHGPLVWEPQEKIQEYIQHRRERERAVLKGVRAGLRTPEELVPMIYTDVAAFLHGLACYSVQAHLEKLEGEGKVARARDGEGYVPV